MNYHKLHHDKIPTILALSAQPVRVYLKLCQYADFDTGLCWPGYKRLKAECRIASGVTLRKAIQELEDAGLIATWLQGNKRHYQVL